MEAERYDDDDDDDEKRFKTLDVYIIREVKAFFKLFLSVRSPLVPTPVQAEEGAFRST